MSRGHSQLADLHLPPAETMSANKPGGAFFFARVSALCVPRGITFIEFNEMAEKIRANKLGGAEADALHRPQSVLH